MFCNHCGFDLPKRSKYCSNCGAEIKYSFLQHIKGWKHWKAIVIILLGAFLLFVLYITIENYIVNNQTGEVKSVQAPTSTNIDIVNQISASVVSIFCPFADNNEDGYWGSGTILTEDGILITNSHVIPQTEKELLTSEYGCLVTLPDPDMGIPIEMYYANPIVIPELSEEYDLAILEIYDVFVDEEGNTYGKYPNTFPAFNDSTFCTNENIKLGEPVRIFGYPASSGNNSLTITEGVVSNFPDDGKTILTSAKVDSGNSGGLAVDQNGCQLGIPSAVSIGEYENLGVIIVSSTVYEFLDKYIKLLD